MPWQQSLGNPQPVTVKEKQEGVLGCVCVTVLAIDQEGENKCVCA